MAALAARYGLDFSEIEPVVAPRANFGTFRLSRKAGLPEEIHEVLVVRLPGAEWGKDSVETYRRALWTLFGALAALEIETAIASVSLPLIGGSRRYPAVEAMRATLDFASGWLCRSPHARTVDFYLFEDPQVEAWNAAMNQILGRTPFASGSSAVVRAVCEELLARLTNARRLDQGRFRELRGALDEALRARNIYLQHIAVLGRRLVEATVDHLLAEIGRYPPHALEEGIRLLEKEVQVAPWLISPFHALRILGNESAHARDPRPCWRPPPLDAHDELPVLCSILRVIAFLEERDEGASIAAPVR